VAIKTLQLWLVHSIYEQKVNKYSHIVDAFNKKEAEKSTANRHLPDN